MPTATFDAGPSVAGTLGYMAWLNAPEKAAKDLLQAATLAAALVEQGDESLADSWPDVPAGMRTTLAKSRPALQRALASHPQTLEQFELALP